jgi:uncharacterized protein (TIGR03000 family)
MFRTTFTSIGGLLLSAAILLFAAGTSEAARGGGFHGGGFHGGGFHAGGFHSFGGFRGPGFHGAGFHPYAGNRFYYNHLGRDLRRSYYYGGYGYFPYYGSYGYPYYAYPSYGYPSYYDSLYAPYSASAFNPWSYVTTPTTGQDNGSEGSYYGGPTSTVPVESTPQGEAANISAKVPANTELWFDGHLTTSTGPIREFHTPPLQPGQRYAYEVRARWQENGHEVTQSQKVTLTAGSDIHIEFPLATEKTVTRSQPNVRRSSWSDPVRGLAGSESEK